MGPFDLTTENQELNGDLGTAEVLDLMLLIRHQA
jgi:hypothetical protein